jgi:peptide/nickel transport system permease protein
MSTAPKIEIEQAALARDEAIESTWRLVLRRFVKHRMAVAGLVVLVLVAGAAVFAPLLTPYPPNAVDVLNILAPPSAKHLLGTDEVGRDVLTRLLYAGRISLSIGIAVALVSTLLGTVVGAVAGYFGGLVDALLMRFVDLMLSVPFLFFLLLIVAIFQPSVPILVLVISLFSWMGLARIVRGQFLSIKTREFIEAARAEGASDLRIILQHILPNALSPIIVNLTLAIAGAIYTESALSFLGFGVQPPTASWGSMLNAAQEYLWTQPLLALYPGIMILITCISVNLIGDGLRDALDPQQRR